MSTSFEKRVNTLEEDNGVAFVLISDLDKRLTKIEEQLRNLTSYLKKVELLVTDEPDA